MQHPCENGAKEHLLDSALRIWEPETMTGLFFGAEVNQGGLPVSAVLSGVWKEADDKCIRGKTEGLE